MKVIRPQPAVSSLVRLILRAAETAEIQCFSSSISFCYNKPPSESISPLSFATQSSLGGKRAPFSRRILLPSESPSRQFEESLRCPPLPCLRTLAWIGPQQKVLLLLRWQAFER